MHIARDRRRLAADQHGAHAGADNRAAVIRNIAYSRCCRHNSDQFNCTRLPFTLVVALLEISALDVP